MDTQQGDPLLRRVEAILAGRLSASCVRKGETIFGEGSPVRFLYGLRSGVVKLARSGFHGKEWIVRLAGAGDLLGLCDLLDHQDYGASAVALTRVSLWRAPARLVRERLESDAELMRTLARGIVRHARRLEFSLELFSNGKAEERIANLLAHLAVPCEPGDGASGCIPFPLTRKDMAEMVGITPETCSRTLSGFRRCGVVREDTDGSLRVSLPALRAYFSAVESDRPRAISRRPLDADDPSAQSRSLPG